MWNPDGRIPNMATENDGHFLVNFHQFPKGSHFWDFELKTSFPLFSSSFSWERLGELK